ncbi:hypothetical protein K1719_040630 [Acacia pycnantha]|nr:hypothetical protein K1719_040630 [Acacia pycnantha]
MKSSFMALFSVSINCVHTHNVADSKPSSAQNQRLQPLLLSTCGLGSIPGLRHSGPRSDPTNKRVAFSHGVLNQGKYMTVIVKRFACVDAFYCLFFWASIFFYISVLWKIDFDRSVEYWQQDKWNVNSENAKVEQVKASMENGVLTVTDLKEEGEEARREAHSDHRPTGHNHASVLRLVWFCAATIAMSLSSCGVRVC